MSPSAELIALRGAADHTGSLVPMTKDQSSLLQIIGRYFDRYPVPGKRFYPILFHPSGGVGDEGVSVIELNAIAGVGQYLSYETLEFQEFFFRQFMILLNDLPDAVGGQ